MSYGQSSHSNGPWQSQPAAGSPTYPSAPPHALAPRKARESQHPGWLARSLFWAALIIGMLPVLAENATTGVMIGVLVQAVWLALIFASLGLFHLLARANGGTAPAPAQSAY